ncbi:MAG: glycosyltransferase, partial [Nitrososphaerota archaeon]
LTIKSKYPGTIYYKNLSDRELAELYSRSRITICPQRWETFGYVEVESMACGTPVVAFNCMGVQETVIDGKTGWLAKNRREFLKMLDFILRNKEIQMDRDFIRRHVEENFSINTSVRKLEEVLKVIVDDQEKYLR